MLVDPGRDEGAASSGMVSAVDREAVAGRSPTPELRVPLLAEGLQALTEVLAARRQLQAERLLAHSSSSEDVLGLVQQPLGQPEGDGRAVRELRDDLVGLRLDVLGLVGRVDRDPTPRPAARSGGDPAAGGRGPGPVRPVGSAATSPRCRGEPRKDERLPEGGVLRGDGDVGGQRQLEPEARGPPRTTQTTGTWTVLSRPISRWAVWGTRRWMLPTRGARRPRCGPRCPHRSRSGRRRPRAR